MKAFEKCVDASRKSWYRKAKVAVLDTGVDIKHPDILTGINNGRIKYYDFVEDSETVIDLDGHGTHCASILAKLAPNAEIFVGRVFQHSQAVENSAAIVAKVNFQFPQLYQYIYL